MRRENLTDWYPTARHAAADAVAWSEQAAADAWHHGPGLLNALGDLHNCVMADAATRHRDLTERPHRSLPAIVRGYVDRQLMAMGDTVPPLAEVEIEDARVRVAPPDLAPETIERLRREIEESPCF